MVASADSEHRLSSAEIGLLDAITARLIPSDETGPGAREAMVVRYIDNALQSDYAAQLADYRRGLSATEEYSLTTFGHGFTELAEPEQDAVLAALERGEAANFEPSASVFFAKVRQHTIEGMFGDPSWGGNFREAGWKLLGYNGPKRSWSAEEQAIEMIPAQTTKTGEG